MKIVVFIKQITQIYARSGMQADRHFLSEYDRIFRVNPFDEAAMQLAAQIKDGHDNVSITAVVFGPIIAQKELYRCLAFGADEVLHITDSQDKGPFESPDARQKSKIFADAIAPLKADLLLCGKKSLDTGSGQIGALLAHHLDTGFVSAVTGLHIDPLAGTLQAKRKCGRGVTQRVECRLPAVCSVALEGAMGLPAWENKQNARMIPFEKVQADASQTRARVQTREVFPPRPRPKAVPPLNTRLSSHDRISQLLSPSLVKKKGEIKKGSPGELAKKLFQLLNDHDFLPTGVNE